LELDSAYGYPGRKKDNYQAVRSQTSKEELEHLSYGGIGDQVIILRKL
jgi:hypothetical protein